VGTWDTACDTVGISYREEITVLGVKTDELHEEMGAGQLGEINVIGTHSGKTGI
jgi:hypothetical protein